jgi:hypothetical protein
MCQGQRGLLTRRAKQEADPAAKNKNRRGTGGGGHDANKTHSAWCGKISNNIIDLLRCDGSRLSTNHPIQERGSVDPVAGPRYGLSRWPRHVYVCREVRSSSRNLSSTVRPHVRTDAFLHAPFNVLLRLSSSQVAYTFGLPWRPTLRSKWKMMWCFGVKMS